MQKISCLVVDDEPLALDLVGSYVLKTPFLELKGKCHNAFEALEKINNEKIDLIFLDIQMPDLSGMDLAKTLPGHTRIIFTTAFSEYALDGFRVDAVDYLLKPFNYQEFLKAANKALERLTHVAKDKAAEKDRQFIFVKSEYRQVKINLDDVIYFEGLKDYIKIWLKDQPRPVLTLMSLKALEEELPADKFMRVHRSYIIALGKIETVERGQAIMNGTRISIAEPYKARFQSFISKRSLS